jgi:hypothetical protein
LKNSLEDASADTGVSGGLVLSVLSMEGRGSQVLGDPTNWLGMKQIAAETKKTLIGLNPEGMNQVSVGPAQLKGPARAAAGLSRTTANSYPGAISGAATWLSTKNPQVGSGYSDVQRAAVYNGGAIGGPGYRNGGLAYGVQAATIKANFFIDRE